MPIDFEAIFKTLRQEVSSLALSSLKELANEATSDGHMLLDTLKDNLKNWSEELAAGDLSEEDFKDLVLGQKDIIKMVALKQKGLMQAKADKFKSDVLNLITNTIIGLL